MHETLELNDRFLHALHHVVKILTWSSLLEVAPRPKVVPNVYIKSINSIFVGQSTDTFHHRQIADYWRLAYPKYKM